MNPMNCPECGDDEYDGDYCGECGYQRDDENEESEP